jgi:hypothetical protein
MRKYYLILIGFTISFFYFGCKKSDSLNNFSDNIMIENAKTYFDESVLNNLENYSAVQIIQNSRLNSPKKPIWEKAYTIQLGNIKAVVVPIQYDKVFYLKTNFGGNKLFSINDLCQLLIYQDENKNYHAERVISFPDSNYILTDQKSFTGIILVEDWKGNLLNEYEYEKGIVKKLVGSKNGRQSNSTTVVNAEPSMETKPDLAVIQVCYTIVEYNYAVDDPENGIYSSETLGCDSYFFADIGSVGGVPSGSNYGAVAGGGGGGSAGSPANNFILLNGNNIIANIKAYNDCFTNIGGNNNSFQVSICVAQPSPGSRTPWNFSNMYSSSSSGNPVSVGHSFLIMKQSTPNGTVTRNVGFYPKTRVTPASPSDQGQLNDDELYPYNISLTLNVNNGQFFNILNFINQGNNPGFQYNMNSNNCASFVLRALMAGGIYLPSTTGNWAFGSGNDPGDLGEDIRAMTLSSNMSRNLNASYHPNQGSCLPAP